MPRSCGIVQSVFVAIHGMSACKRERRLGELRPADLGANPWMTAAGASSADRVTTNPSASTTDVSPSPPTTRTVEPAGTASTSSRTAACGDVTTSSAATVEPEAGQLLGDRRGRPRRVVRDVPDATARATPGSGSRPRGRSRGAPGTRRRRGRRGPRRRRRAASRVSHGASTSSATAGRRGIGSSSCCRLVVGALVAAARRRPGRRRRPRPPRPRRHRTRRRARPRLVELVRAVVFDRRHPRRLTVSPSSSSVSRAASAASARSREFAPLLRLRLAAEVLEHRTRRRRTGRGCS